MKKVEILVVCTNAEILAVILRLINANEEWNATGAGSYTATKDALQSGTYSILLLGAGLAGSEESDLREFVKTDFSELKLVDHFGGGSGLLFAEIYQALA